eukprot:TRINITY_DN19953_c0_g8_i1.p1 TRINITY_DN19953_c0_g8~~TRINITY_DN19953_c0_g8_i1.p1  ORF type:complete len:502 (-),score=19.96 TRINITY_DN19953_c0_g8_i1:291-1796(-)
MKSEQKMNRRDALKSIGVGTILASTTMYATPSPTKESARESGGKRDFRVLVCGAGFAGLSVAKNLKILNPDISVGIIEKRSHFQSCPYSNAWLGGIASYEELNRDFFAPAQKYGYDYINATITHIDRASKKVQTTSGEFGYEVLVLAPGIDYDYSAWFNDDSLSAEKCREMFPPALMPGSEHLALKRGIESFRGGNFVITVPTAPFRCPPAPYERACMIAYRLKQKGIKGKVLVLDPNTMPVAKPSGFLNTFKELYPEIIEYHPSTKVVEVDLKNNELRTEKFDKKILDYKEEKVAFENANLMPKNRAGELINIANLDRNKGGWAKLRGFGFRSAQDSDVYIIGDAQGEHPYPKSAHMANNCANIAANHISQRLAGNEPNEVDILPGNICYSIVNGSPKEGIVVQHQVSYDPKKGLVVKAYDTKKRDTLTGEATTQWFDGIMNDILGQVWLDVYSDNPNTKSEKTKLGKILNKWYQEADLNRRPPAYESQIFKETQEIKGF